MGYCCTLSYTSDLEQYYLYNAKDTWATAWVFLTWMFEAPDWARQNYLMEFPLQFPCHLSEMTGIKRDPVALLKARGEVDGMITKKSALLDSYLGVQNFNVNSAPQMKGLMKVLGCSDLPGADEKALSKAAYRHPLNAHIIELIRGVPKTDNVDLMGIRSLRKMKSTYLRLDSDKTSEREDNGGKEYKD